MSKQVLEGYKEKRKILKEISKRNEEKKNRARRKFSKKLCIIRKNGLFKKFKPKIS